jgi:hypothetical protein
LTEHLQKLDNGRQRVADGIRALRLAIWRDWERLYAEAQRPGFTGTIGMELSWKEGRPGIPRFTRETYGISE